MQSNDVDIENLLVIMANLPDFLRNSVSRQKVKELVDMRDEEKRDRNFKSDQVPPKYSV